MTSHVIGAGTEPAASKRWLAQQFPHRPWLIADLQQRIDRALAPISAYPPNPDRFGQAMERTLALDLCDEPPYPQLIASLPEHGRGRLLTTAGYAPTTDAPGRAVAQDRRLHPRRSTVHSGQPATRPRPGSARAPTGDTR